MLAAHEESMNVTCPQCATVFRVDPAKVPERGVRARCSVCAGLIAVRRPAAASPALPRESVPTIAAPMPTPVPMPSPPPASPVVVEPPLPPMPFQTTAVWPTSVPARDSTEAPIPPLSPPSVPFDTLPKDSAMPQIGRAHV